MLCCGVLPLPRGCYAALCCLVSRVNCVWWGQLPLQKIFVPRFKSLQLISDPSLSRLNCAFVISTHSFACSFRTCRQSSSLACLRHVFLHSQIAFPLLVVRSAVPSSTRLRHVSVRCPNHLPWLPRKLSPPLRNASFLILFPALTMERICSSSLASFPVPTALCLSCVSLASSAFPLPQVVCVSTVALMVVDASPYVLS